MGGLNGSRILLHLRRSRIRLRFRRSYIRRRRRHIRRRRIRRRIRRNHHGYRGTRRIRWNVQIHRADLPQALFQSPRGR